MCKDQMGGSLYSHTRLHEGKEKERKQSEVIDVQEVLNQNKLALENRDQHSANLASTVRTT